MQQGTAFPNFYLLTAETDCSKHSWALVVLENTKKMIPLCKSAPLLFYNLHRLTYIMWIFSHCIYSFILLAGSETRIPDSINWGQHICKSSTWNYNIHFPIKITTASGYCKAFFLVWTIWNHGMFQCCSIGSNWNNETCRKLNELMVEN